MNDENPHKQTNLEPIQALDKTTRITALDWANNNNEILIGRVRPVVKVYGCETDQYFEELAVEEGPVVGLCKYNGKLVAGLANGKIQIGTQKPQFLVAGDAMNRLRQCAVDRKLVATGGKERQNNLKVWNLEKNECVFKTKNLPNDYLQLEVPIWDNDFAFIDANCLTTGSRHGYVRVYDMRKQRRPTLCYANEKAPIAYGCLATHGDVVYVGSTNGIMHAFDLRKMKHVLHTYKGFTGSISDVVVDDSGRFVCTASLDRFVRVHDAATTGLLYQSYVKSKATRVLLREGKIKEETLDNEEAESSEEEGYEQEAADGSEDNGVDENDDDAEEFDALFDNMQTVEYVHVLINIM